MRVAILFRDYLLFRLSIVSTVHVAANMLSPKKTSQQLRHINYKTYVIWVLPKQGPTAKRDTSLCYT